MFTASIAPDAQASTNVAHPAGPAQEVELKFLVDEATFKAAQASALLGADGVRRLGQRIETTYFDTAEGDLQRNKVALRMRRRRRGYMMGVKWSGSDHGASFSRPELEVATPSSTPDIAGFGEEVSASLNEMTEGRPLQPTFVTNVRRLTRIVRAGASDIEVAFDQGFINAGDRKEALREVELELKAGEPADLYRFGLALLDAFPVRLGFASKSARGAQLMSDKGLKAVRAREPSISPEETLDDLIATIVRACIGQFAANWAVFEAGDAVEAVHQMRVALRRLRAALALFQRELPCAEFAAFREEAKRIATVMGDARNADVFGDLINDLEAAYGADRGFELLRETAKTSRQQGYAAVRELVSGLDPTRFVLSVEEFITRKGWRNALSVPDLAKLTNSAQSFAAANLERLHRRVRKRGKDLLNLPPEERHKVRIALKNLRYACDFFAAPFDKPTQARRYIRAVGRMQDVLGAYNDMIVAVELVRQVDVGGNPDMARAAGVMMGWYSRGAAVGDGELKEAWSAFRKTDRFWSASE